MTKNIKQRERDILGQPPRILPKHSPEIIKAAQEHTAKLRGGSSQNAAPVAIADIPEMVVTLLGCDADLYERMAAVSVQLLAKSTLPKRDFELIVLRTDWLCQSPYNWGEHVRIAKRFGITSEEIENITLGSTASAWNEHERALLRAAEELHANAMLSDKTWSVLERTFSEKQLFELIVLIGQFTLVTYVQNSLRLRLSAGNEGLSAR